jgi:DNA cross-link repair 1A protein
VYGVPYSEHSSFEELRAFVHALQPRSVVPTVNAGAASARAAMQALFADWCRPSV